MEVISPAGSVDDATVSRTVVQGRRRREREREAERERERERVFLFPLLLLFLLLCLSSLPPTFLSNSLQWPPPPSPLLLGPKCHGNGARIASDYSCTISFFFSPLFHFVPFLKCLWNILAELSKIGCVIRHVENRIEVKMERGER